MSVQLTVTKPLPKILYCSNTNLDLRQCNLLSPMEEQVPSAQFEKVHHDYACHLLLLVSARKFKM